MDMMMVMVMMNMVMHIVLQLLLCIFILLCFFVTVPPKLNRQGLHTELKVVQNRTAYINCPISGIPQPSIIWYKDDFPLLDWPYDDMRLLGNERRLEVSNAQVDDGGTYTCKATNPAGQVKQEFTLTVQGEWH